jgi:hypothetical protein
MRNRRTGSEQRLWQSGSASLRFRSWLVTGRSNGSPIFRLSTRSSSATAFVADRAARVSS